MKGDVLANYVTVKGAFDGHMECNKLLIVRLVPCLLLLLLGCAFF